MLRKLRSRLMRLTPYFMRVPKPAPGIGAYAAEDGLDMEAYWAEIGASLAPFANPFAYYEEIVGRLRGMENLAVVPAYELMQRAATGVRLVTLRHDLDSDPLTGLRAARTLARHGMCGSFYLLHTSAYYAHPHGPVVIRNPELRRWIRAFVVTGCELGLHNDALGVYQNWRKDGISALLAEIAFLRAQGAIVRGTVAHNSGPVYGAENYEIFSGRRLWQRRVRVGEQREVPLGLLSERALGLSYEGTFAAPKRDRFDEAAAAAFFKDRAGADVRSEAWMRRYLLDNPCCDWAVDYQFWLVGKDTWVAAGRFGGATLFEWNIALERALQLLSALPPGSRTLMVLHPEYVRG